MILISGATGNVGKELVQRLLDQGSQIRVLIRDQRKATHFGNRVEVVVGDLDRPHTLAMAMQGVDCLYFVTPITEQVVNSLFTSNTIEWWGATIRSQNAVYFPGGKGKVPPAHPRDVAAVAYAVLTNPEHEGQIYEVTGPAALTIGEMVQTLAKVLDKPLRYVNIPAFLAALGLRRFGMSRALVKALMETLGALRRNEYADVTDVVERVGGVTPHTFEAWCRENIDAFH